MKTQIFNAYATPATTFGVKSIDWALNRNCNRAGGCPWCPNDKQNRSQDEILVSDDDIRHICQNLKELNYQGSISFNRYNEPFARKDFPRVVGLIRSLLPDVRLGCNTNGSLVTKENLRAVYEAGLSSMNFQLYPNTPAENASFTYAWAHRKAEEACNRLGLAIDESHIVRKDGLYYEFSIILPEEWNLNGSVTMVMYAKKLTALGCDRGGSVKNLSKKRTMPCVQVGRFLGIDANGDVSPCTNMTGRMLGIAQHCKCVIGNALTERLEDILASNAQMVEDLTTNFSEETLKKYPICAGCSFIPHVQQINSL